MAKQRWLAVGASYSVDCPKHHIEVSLADCRACKHAWSVGKDGVECSYDPNEPEQKGNLMNNTGPIRAIQHTIVALRSLANDLEVIQRILDEKESLILGNIVKLEKELEELQKKGE